MLVVSTAPTVVAIRTEAFGSAPPFNAMQRQSSVVLLMRCQPTPCNHNPILTHGPLLRARAFWRFSLRGLFGVTLAVALLLTAARLALPWKEYRQEVQLIRELQAIDALYKTEVREIPFWVRAVERLIPARANSFSPSELYRRTTAVFVQSDQIDNDWCRYLQSASRLNYVILQAPLLDDDGLKHFVELESVNVLHLYSVPITDAGVEQLGGMKQLRDLILYDSMVSDAGLRRLRELLPNTEVSTEGFEYSFPEDFY